jgi:triacylglycerol lipase
MGPPLWLAPRGIPKLAVLADMTIVGRMNRLCTVLLALVLTAPLGNTAESSDASISIAKQFPFLAKVPRIRAAEGDYVIVVHGLTWAKATMKRMGAHLHANGYHTIEVHYPSRSIPLEEIVTQYIQPAIVEHCPDKTRRIHFVGHSMGCIVIRKLLADHPIENLGKVVLLAAPNQGTEMADFFTQSAPFQKILGPAVKSIGTGPDSWPNRLGHVDFAPGIIMGLKEYFPLVSELIPGADDGVVRVESGKVSGMAELIVVPTTHIRMPSARIVKTQTGYFLRHGKFEQSLTVEPRVKKNRLLWRRPAS